MKPYRILKAFNGSQHGHDFVSFAAGSEAPLSDALAAIAVREGWAKPVELGAALAPVAGLDEPIPAGDLAHDLRNPAEVRETKVVTPAEAKVVEPEETKPAKPLHKMSKAELVTHALTAHGLELVGDSMTVKEMIAAIEAAQKAEA